VRPNAKAIHLSAFYRFHSLHYGKRRRNIALHPKSNLWEAFANR
jgi:hypothetical protein